MSLQSILFNDHLTKLSCKYSNRIKTEKYIVRECGLEVVQIMNPNSQYNYAIEVYENDKFTVKFVGNIYYIPLFHLCHESAVPII